MGRDPFEGDDVLEHLRKIEQAARDCVDDPALDELHKELDALIEKLDDRIPARSKATTGSAYAMMALKHGPMAAELLLQSIKAIAMDAVATDEESDRMRGLSEAVAPEWVAAMWDEDKQERRRRIRAEFGLDGPAEKSEADEERLTALPDWMKNIDLPLN